MSVEVEKSNLLKSLRDKLIAEWLRRIFLKWLARRHEEFFIQLLKDLALDKKSFEIMKARYILGKTFKEIPPLVRVEDRQMYKLHQKVIDKLVDLRV